jgi:hypothetical protein
MELPPGLEVLPTEGSTPTSRPVLWVSKRPYRSLGKALPTLYKAFPSTGLWPLALESLHGDDDRPWLSGELDPDSSTSPEGFDVLSVLSEWWQDSIPSGEDADESDDLLAPFGSKFPGLAPPGVKPVSEGSPEEFARSLEGRLGLVPARRPADTPAIIGWMGPLNSFSDMALLCCVLRSWEERFDAFLVGMGFATLTLAVGRPPRTLAEALPIAAEHYAACYDNIVQGAGSIAAYAEELVDAPSWSFWWD